MSMTDPVADFLTRLRNAAGAQKETVAIPSSLLKRELARILTEQGYIEGFEVEPPTPGRAASSPSGSRATSRSSRTTACCA